jgi:hypothetical protein
MWPCQHLLQHEGIDVDHAILQQMQCEHADFMVLTPIAHQFATACEEDEVSRTVPLFYNVQSLVDFAA